MRIGELARRTGVSERSLRFYEERGMLASDRTPGGHREYPDTAIDRVVRIQELYAAGLGTSAISTVLPCLRDVDGGPTADATPLLLEQLGAERDRLDRAMRDLAGSRAVLDDVIEAAAHD